VQDVCIGVHILAFELENFRAAQAGAQGKPSHVMQLRMGDFQIRQQGFGFVLGKEAQSGVVDLDHTPDAAFGGKWVSSAPQAGGDGPVNGGTQEIENIVDGGAGKEFGLFPLGSLGGFDGGLQQFGFDGGEQSWRDFRDGGGVDFGLDMGAVLPVVLVNVFAFAFAPGVVGVNGLSHCYFVAFNRVYAGGGDFGQEFGSVVAGGLGANALAVSAYGFPVAFSLVVGEPDAVNAVGFAGAGIAFRGEAIEDAFEFGLDVFSVGFVAHVATLGGRWQEGKKLI
jgi:hypothetical protein